MAGLEATIEREVCRRAYVEYGVENIKMRVAGWPDRCFFIPGGQPLMIEFKAPGEESDPYQQYIHDKLRKLKYKVQVHDNIERALQAITNALEPTRLSKKGR